MPKPSGIDLLPPWHPPAHSFTSAADVTESDALVVEFGAEQPLAQRLVGVSSHVSPCLPGPGTMHPVSPWLPTTAHSSSCWVQGCARTAV